MAHIPQTLHYSVITWRRHSSHPAMATAAPMSSMRPQQRQVKPLFSFSLRTHEQGCSDIKSAKANFDIWDVRPLGLLASGIRCCSLRAIINQPRHDSDATAVAFRGSARRVEMI